MTFTVMPQQMSLVVGKDGLREVRPEKLQIQVGGSAVIDPSSLTQDLTLEGAPHTPEYRFIEPIVK